MHTPATFMKHPIHPMLIAVPIGMWSFALVCDLLSYFSDFPWAWHTALVTMCAGLVGAFIAAVPGFVDYTFIRKRNPRARRIGAYHMALNLLVMALYGTNIFLRIRGDFSSVPFYLSVAAFVLLIAGGWLGGELVYVERVSVEEPEEHDLRFRRVA